MGNAGWKQFERRIARDHGVERQAVTGERDGSDVMTHPRYVISCKLRQAIPKTIRAWADSIYRCATRHGKLGVLVIKEPGKQDDSALVVLRYKDWLTLQRDEEELVVSLIECERDPLQAEGGDDGMATDKRSDN
jgi:hypothetical protein